VEARGTAGRKSSRKEEGQARRDRCERRGGGRREKEEKEKVEFWRRGGG